MTQNKDIDSEFAMILKEQQRTGTHFDVRTAERYYAELAGERAVCLRNSGVPASLSKIITMLAEGDKAWLRLVDGQGFIHGEVIPDGTVTGRCTHRNPNLAQVPARGEMGERCRGLFTAPPDMPFMVGADASSLELRILAHYLADYDGGEYARLVESGDIHELNRQAAGLETREQAKEFIYAFLYGAGDERLGAIAYPLSTKDEQLKAGSVLRHKFLINLPALRWLIKELSLKTHIITLDAKPIPISNPRTALHTLVQSGGAAVIKYATVFWHDICGERCLQHGVDYVQCLHVHDEVQAYAKTQAIANIVGQSFCDALAAAGERLNLNCRMTGKYKIGKSWKETH